MKAFYVSLHAWTWAAATHAGMEARKLYGPHAGIRTAVNTQLGEALAYFTATAELSPALTHSPGGPGTGYAPGAQSAAGPCLGGSAGKGKGPGPRRPCRAGARRGRRRPAVPEPRAELREGTGRPQRHPGEHWRDGQHTGNTALRGSVPSLPARGLRDPFGAGISLQKCHKTRRKSR